MRESGNTRRPGEEIEFCCMISLLNTKVQTLLGTRRRKIFGYYKSRMPIDIQENLNGIEINGTQVKDTTPPLCRPCLHLFHTGVKRDLSDTSLYIPTKT